MPNDIALEALLQRGKTPLYHDLVSLYQKSQEALYELKNASPEEYIKSLQNMDFPTKLKTILIKHTGFFIKDIRLIASKNPGAHSGITISNDFYRNMAQGKQLLGSATTLLQNAYDQRLGKLDTDQIKTLDFGFTIALYMGYWRLRRPDQSYYFTPEELTAITLHEIGHCEVYIKTLGIPVLTLANTHDLITYVRKQPSQQMINQIIAILVKSPYLDKSWDPVLMAVDQHEGDVHEQAIVLETAMAAELYGYQLSQMNALLYAKLPDIKTDNVSTSNYRVDAERAADDYAVRHGAGQDIASALEKQAKVTKANQIVDQHSLTWSIPSVVFGILDGVSNIFSIKAIEISSNYDPLIRRVELIIQTANHAFAQSNLDPKLVEDLKQQINQAELHLMAIRKSPYIKTRTQLMIWKANVHNLGRLILSPFSNRIERDYKTLQDATRDLSRHSLYYLAKK